MKTLFTNFSDKKSESFDSLFHLTDNLTMKMNNLNVYLLKRMQILSRHCFTTSVKFAPCILTPPHFNFFNFTIICTTSFTQLSFLTLAITEICKKVLEKKVRRGLILQFETLLTRKS